MNEATKGPSTMSAVVASRATRTGLADLDWQDLGTGLNETGCALIPKVLSPAECAALARHYDDDRRFRSRVIMARHGFGRGEYKYLAYPLPEVVQRLRAALYPPLAVIANRDQRVPCASLCSRQPRSSCLAPSSPHSWGRIWLSLIHI